MPADAPAADRSAPEAISRFLAAVALTVLALCAHRWARDGSPHVAEETYAIAIAAIAGLSAILAWAPGSLLLRTALHLATLWLAAQALGREWSVLIDYDAFLAGSAAFFAALALRVLWNAGLLGDEDAPSSRLRWSTSELLSGLFVLGAYAAIGRQLSSVAGPHPPVGLGIAALHAGLPYLALAVARRLFGRARGSVALCLAAATLVIVFPSGAPINPFAVALVAAMSALGRRESKRTPSAALAARASS